MAKLKIRSVDIIYAVAIIVVDLFVFITLGLLLMDYDDHYHPSKGEYSSLASMSPTEKIIYICYNTWLLLNIIGLVYIARKIYKTAKANVA